jgi:small-conductance mechanosensitive channel
MEFTIKHEHRHKVDISFPGLAAILGGLLASISTQLSQSEGRIMEAFDALKAELANLTTEVNALRPLVEEANNSTDALALQSQLLVDAVAVLVNASQTGGNITAADVQPLLDQATAMRQSIADMKASLTLQDTETDAAAAAAAAGLPGATPTP